MRPRRRSPSQIPYYVLFIYNLYIYNAFLFLFSVRSLFCFCFIFIMLYSFFILSWHTSLNQISNGANVKNVCATLFQSPMETTNTFSYQLLLLRFFFRLGTWLYVFSIIRCYCGSDCIASSILRILQVSRYYFVIFESITGLTPGGL